ncbi:MAG: hypothetical protein AABW46_04310 [Nanoarchaeota archaeon]
MDDRLVIVLIIIALFALYLVGGKLGLTGEVIGRYCIDSDYGIKIYEAGHVVSDIGKFSDRCNTGLISVKEYYCDEGYGGNNKVRSNFIECGLGYTCLRDVNGTDDACVKI